MERSDVSTESDSDSDHADSKPSPKESEANPSREPSLPLGCRRVRVSSRLLSSSTSKLPVHVIIRIPPTAAQEDSVSILPENLDASLVEDYLIVNGHRLGYVLDRLQPRYVILYQPRVAWVRELEVHLARRYVKPLQTNTEETVIKDLDDVKIEPLEVFFMLYESSVEEQCYLTSLRRVCGPASRQNEPSFIRNLFSTCNS